GQRVRRLRQAARLRQVGVPLPPPHLPPVEPERADRSRDGRPRHPPSGHGVHVLPEGGQGHPRL
ncbi:MAG: LSU ribosomal protein L28p @ LSU ribosomal protein L28p, zinc-dependent, partial [uncultured Corynebacteriales bacterium]